MNRVERLARQRAGRMTPMRVTSAEAPAGQPVAGTPAVFAAYFAVGYAVARAFGPAEVRDAVAYQDQLAGADLDGLIGVRAAAL